MKLKDLPKETNILNILLILPDDILELFKDYMGGEKEMYYVGFVLGDYFMTPDDKSTPRRRLYALPIGVEPYHLLEWEVKE